MPSSRTPSYHRVLLGLLLAANAATFLVWPRLVAVAPKSDSSERIVAKPGLRGRLRPMTILHNEAYLRWFFETVRAEGRVVFFGTSESVFPYHLAAQLNHLRPQDPPLADMSMGGLSPIHGCLVFAQAKEEGIRVPPLVLTVNLVYLTQSHDVINDGWMGVVVRSPLFLYMDHGGVRRHLSAEVRGSIADHFAWWHVLYPLRVQEYVGNLVFLACHQAGPTATRDLCVPAADYAFSGAVPAYDETRHVHVGSTEVDRFTKSRWEVKTVQDCVNLKGLACSLSLLREEGVPVLVLVLPVNRAYYASHGLDMERYDRRNRALRDAIAELATGGGHHVIDLGAAPPLHFGFKDRMHPDAYGTHQLARYLVASAEYERFAGAVRAHYATAGR